MGKDWDKVVMGVEYWKECLRVLKAGSLIFVMSAPRQDVLSRAIINLQDAGFDIRFSSLAWCFASGFPKSSRINRNPKFCQCGVTGHNDENKDHESKKGDHTYKEDIFEYDDHLQDDEQHLKDTQQDSQDDYQQNYDLCDEQPPSSSKNDQELFQQQEYALKHNHSDEHEDVQISESSHNPLQVQDTDHHANKDYLSQKSSSSNKQNDNALNKGKLGDVSTRKDNGKLSSRKSRKVLKSSYNKVNGLQYHSTSGFPLCQQCKKPVADGFYAGAQMKPAYEKILIAMKPLSEKNYSEQAYKNGKGGTYLDNCRIPYESEDDKNSMDIRHYQQEDCFQNKEPKKSKFQVKESNPQGRFPANLISSDNVLDDGRVSKTNSTGLNSPADYKTKSVFGAGHGSGAIPYGDDIGSFNRYFDLDKWFTQRLKKLPESVQKVFPFLIVPKAGKSEKNKGCDELEEKQLHTRGCHKSSVVERPPEYKVQNNHPTSKPIKLMSYLITLGSREGDIVLDPFAGSGTTAIAAKMLKRKYIGIEKEKEYCKIAEERLKAFQEPML